ncbi:BlaI/MecI/CopY family transcriptional regulator [Salinarchaeum laminariae]|uniref:BlaI/MecI/CopY family transcriptional regulator n=1 Tax=Salinarchaeum laminariae TaxID=869888 RepID=UPI0020BD7858|nr:BlaI/MecI/CopY family transcriptional regulator [Salinarchaeum laminariae]
MGEEANVIIPSPTSSGKSYNAGTTPWKTLSVAGDAPVIHLHARKDSRRDAMQMSEDAGIDAVQLLGRDEACGTFRGEYDENVSTPNSTPASEWLSDQCVNRGNTLSKAHSYLEEENVGQLPCCPCPSVEQWNGVPYDEDGNVSHDVVHATHSFSYVPSIASGTNLIFDERPDFKSSVGDRPNDDITRSRLQDAVTAWLKEIDAPVKTWERFVTFAIDSVDELGDLVKDPPSASPDWFIEADGAHSLAPGLTEAAYRAFASESDRNGRRVGEARNDVSRFDPSGEDDPRYSRTRLTLVVDEENIPTAYWNVPELGNARSIICLDAWPAVYEWKQNVGDGLKEDHIVTEEEFEKWRKFERGLEVVQIGDSARPASTEFAVREYTDTARQQIVVESLRTKYAGAFSSAIYPKAMDEQMSEHLPDGVSTLTYGNVRSSNEFSNELVGLVTNCLDPGDDYVLDLLAARDLDAEPETWKCIGCPGDECPMCGGEPDRKPGRGFVGPDADDAEEILDGIRQNQVAQGIGRWARSHDSPRALVFVRTSTAPATMVDTEIDAAWKFTPKQQAVVDFVRENRGAAANEIVTATDVSYDTVRRTMNRLVDLDVAKKEILQRETRFLLTEPIPTDGVLEGIWDLSTPT